MQAAAPAPASPNLQQPHLPRLHPAPSLPLHAKHPITPLLLAPPHTRAPTSYVERPCAMSASVNSTRLTLDALLLASAKLTAPCTHSVCV